MSDAAVTSVSLTNARLRPCALMSRRTISRVAGHIELGLHLGLCLARANQIGRCAAAHQQADGFDEHRFACPGFAGQDVQTGLEFDLDRIDDGEVLNAEEAKHR